MELDYCYIFLLETNKEVEVTVKFTQAQEKILRHLEKRITLGSEDRRVLLELFAQAPKELDFSLSIAKEALAQLPFAKALKPHVELESYIEATANEIFSIGLRLEDECNCGCGRAGHVKKALTYFIVVYAKLVMVETIENTFDQALSERLRDYIKIVDYFRPSDN